MEVMKCQNDLVRELFNLLDAKYADSFDVAYIGTVSLPYVKESPCVKFEARDMHMYDKLHKCLEALRETIA